MYEIFRLSTHYRDKMVALPTNSASAAKALREDDDGRFVSLIPQLAQMKRKRSLRIRYSLLTVLLDIVSITTAYAVASLIYLNLLDLDQLGRILVSLAPISLFFNLNNNAYSAAVMLDRMRSAWAGTSGLIWASLLMFLIFFFLKISEDFSRVLLGLGTILAVVLVAFSRMAVADSLARVVGASPFADLCILDGLEPPYPERGDAVDANEIGLEPTVDDPAMLDLLGRLALGLDSIVIYCREERRAKWAFMLKSLDVHAELVTPEITKLQPLGIQQRFGDVSLVLGSGRLTWSQRVLKRAFDIAASLFVLFVLGPLFLLIAIAIKLDSKGPVLFKQDRIGLGNRKFRIFKFRTMRADMLDHSAHQSTQRSDPRVTRFGDFLRRTSLDELPQFVNVLIGDMSIVGPRPHAEQTAVGSALLWEIDTAYWHRHVVKPGITGLAQVRGLRGSLFEEGQLKERLNADLEYVASWSLANDLKIILRTVSVLAHRNAY